MAQPVLEALPAAQRVDLMGQPLRVAAACIRLANFYVGNDSGLMHIAAAAGTPTLGLFGPSSETRYGPWGEHCAAVRTPEAFKEIVMADGFDYTSQRSLMESLTVDSAYAALEKLYASVKNAPEGNHVTAQRTTAAQRRENRREKSCKRRRICFCARATQIPRWTISPARLGSSAKGFTTIFLIGPRY